MISKILFLLGTLTLPLNGIRYLNFTLSDWFFLGSLAFLSFDIITGRLTVDNRGVFHPFWFPAMLVLIGGMLAAIESVNPTRSLLTTIRMVYLFSLWSTLAVIMIQARGMAKPILHTYILGVVLSSALTIYDSLFGSSYAYQLATASGSLNVSSLASLSYMGRFVGTIGHPNGFGQITAAAIPITLEIAIINFRNRTKWNLIYFLICIGILLWGVYLSGSVAAYLGVLLGIFIVLLVLLGNNIGALLRITGLALCFFLFGISLLGNFQATENIQNQIERNFGRVLETTGPGRITLLTETANLILAKPFTGYGMDQNQSIEGNLGTSLQTDNYVHNSLVLAWVGGGIFTFIGVFIIYAISLKFSLKTIHAHLNGVKHPYIVGLAASFLAWSFIDMTGPSLYTRYTWIITAILIGLSLMNQVKPSSLLKSAESLAVSTNFINKSHR